MKLRISGLAEVDPLSVPLPDGTEVATRVDRALGERRVTQGAIGRVVATHGDELDVDIVGVGVVRYRRDDLLPRKLGQLRYARRREHAWSALRECVVIESVVGSRAWGLAEEGSDTDRRGVFALPFSWTTGLVNPPMDLVSTDASTTYWELGKTIRQAIRADPNTLEMLFVPTARATDEVGEWLLEIRDAFASAEIYGSFGRYALSQLKKLQQSLRLARHRALVVAWLRDEPAMSLDQLADKLAAEAGIEAPTAAQAQLRAKEYIKQLYRSMYDQGLLTGNELAALATYARKRELDLDLLWELRPKNAYNLLRLIATAIHWLRTGTPQLEVGGALRDQLLAIKRGDVPLAEVLRLAEELTPELDAARRDSALPARADVERIDSVLQRVRRELARRAIQNAPGPFGRDAPAPPTAEWE